MNKEERKYMVRRTKEITDHMLERIGIERAAALSAKADKRTGWPSIIHHPSKMSLFDWLKKQPRRVMDYDQIVDKMEEIRRRDYYTPRDPVLSHFFPEFAEYEASWDKELAEKRLALVSRLQAFLFEEQQACDTVILGDTATALISLREWQERVKAFFSDLEDEFGRE